MDVLKEEHTIPMVINQQMFSFSNLFFFYCSAAEIVLLSGRDCCRFSDLVKD